jgi:hypothetical protein
MGVSLSLFPSNETAGSNNFVTLVRKHLQRQKNNNHKPHSTSNLKKKNKSSKKGSGRENHNIIERKKFERNKRGPSLREFFDLG